MELLPTVIRKMPKPEGRFLWLPDYVLARGDLLVIAAFCSACGEFAQAAAVRFPFDMIDICGAATEQHWTLSPLCQGAPIRVPTPQGN